MRLGPFDTNDIYHFRDDTLVLSSVTLLTRFCLIFLFFVLHMMNVQQQQQKTNKQKGMKNVQRNIRIEYK